MLEITGDLTKYQMFDNARRVAQIQRGYTWSEQEVNMRNVSDDT